ncbi:MAG: methenyltetrahydromethanopterin cyclohydrolase [Candidatus Hodarchaeales archaeon]|jgi:methenyltetrahydromethanopterin cyclohydrolase
MSYQLNSKSWEVFKALQKLKNRYNFTESRINGAPVLNFLTDLPDEAGILVVKTQLSNSALISISKLEKDSYFRQLSFSLLPGIPPAILTLGSQFSGWRLQSKGSSKKSSFFTASASGPGRLLSQEPKKLFKKLKYSEKNSKQSVLILETSNGHIPADIISFISRKCKVLPKNLGIILTSANTNVGSILGAARVVEMAIYRAINEGFPPFSIMNATGTAPVVPTQKASTPVEATAMLVDAIAYAGKVELEVQGISDEFINQHISKLISSYSTYYGTLMITNLRKSFQFPREIAIRLLAPSVISIINKNTGKIHQTGELDPQKLTHYWSKKN